MRLAAANMISCRVLCLVILSPWSRHMVSKRIYEKTDISRELIDSKMGGEN